MWPQGRICAISGEAEDAAGKEPQAARQFRGIMLSTGPTLSAHCPHSVCLQEDSDLVFERVKWDSQLSLSPEPDWQYKVPKGCCGHVIEERGSRCPTLLPLLHLFPNNTLCGKYPGLCLDTCRNHGSRPGPAAAGRVLRTPP